MTLTNDQQIIEYLRDKGYNVDVPSPVNMDTRINKLEKRINELESQSGLMSRSWFTRAITAWLYIWGIQLIAGFIVLVLGVIFGLLGN